MALQMEPGEELPELKDAPLAGNGVSIDATDATNPNVDASFAAANPLASGEARLKRKALLTVIVPVGVILLLLLAGMTALLSTSQEPERNSTSRQQPTNQIDTSKLPTIPFEVSTEDEATEVVFNNTVVANGALVLSPALQPTESVLGQIYYDQNTEEVRVYNGDNYTALLEREVGRQLCYVGEDCGFATLNDIPTVPNFPEIPDFPEQVELPQDLAVTATPTFAGLNLSDELAVSEGGTGVSSFANNTLLIGNGSGAIGTTNSATSGQIVVANSSGTPQFRSVSGDITLSDTGVTSLNNNTVDTSELVDTGVSAGTFGDTNNFPIITVDADGRITAVTNQSAPGASGSVASVNGLTGALVIQGTTNQINVASAGSNITLSTPQDLATTSSPTFNGLTVTSITRGLDTITDFTGAGLQVTAGQLETTLGTSIQDAEVDDNITISAGGSVADGALSSNVSLLGGTVELGSETTGTFDSTPDTIADDGVISNAEAADDLTISGSGSVADGALSSNVSLLGGSIQNAEVDDDLTISSGGSVADGALSANVSLLGSSIDLTSEIVGTLSVSNGGTGATTAAAARTNLGLGTLAVLNSVTTTQITNDTILAVDFDNTVAPGASEDGYVLTYDDASGGFTWISQGAVVGGGGGDTTPDTIADDGTITLGVETTGTYDSTPDTIADDGVISDAEAADDLTISGSGSVADGALSVNVSLLGSSIDLATEITGTLAVSNGGTGATTAAQARTNLGLGSLAVLNNVATTQITDDTILAVDLDNTVAPGASEDGYVLTYDDASGGFTWVSQASVGGSGDTTPDTIADDGSISLTTEVGGTLPVANGGTGLTSFTTGDLVYASAANTLSSLAIGTNNQCLIVSGGVPTWGSCAGGGGGFTNLTLSADTGSSETLNDTDTIDIAGGTNINTSVGSTDTVTINLDASPTLTGLLSLTSAGTALNVTNNVTIGGTLTVGSTVFSEADLDALDDGVIALGSETSGTFDSTPDTIADDGVISDAEAADDLTISGSGSVADGALSANVSLLGSSIQDGEVDDDLTVSGSGSVADGALSANVSLLGSSIDLASEITGTLAVSNGGTGATTAAGARTNLGLGTVALLNSVSTTDITNDSLLAVDLDNTVAPGASEDGYVLTYDDATGGFTWVSQGSVVSGGGGDTTPDTIADDGTITLGTETTGTYDSTPDTIADDGVISDAEAADDLTISGSGSVADGALSANVSLLGSSIDLTSEIVGTLSVSNGGTGATTAAAARTNLGLGTLAVLNSVTTTQITNDSILAVDFDNTVAPGASEDGYVLTYDDATGGFTWVSQGSIISGGGGDTTPDTIADDGVISDAEAADDLTISASGSVADGALSVNVSLLGSSIQDGEVDDDLTISGSGSVADGALSVNVSLLGSSIDLTSEITGTLAVSDGGTGATTAAGARTNLGLGGLAVLSSVTTSEITNDTVLAVDLDNTVAPGASEDNYVLTYDDASGGFTWVSQSSIVSGGGGDTTPDTIADDGVISDAEAADDLTISGSGSVADGALSANVSLLGSSIQDGEVDDDLTISSSGSVDDGALSSNVSLLGSSIDLTSEIVGTLSVSNGGTGATTAAAARTNLGLGGLAVLNSVTTSEITNDTILAVDFNNTVAPGVTEDDYVLTYDDATGGFTWVSQASIVSGGGGDTTPDTIADDGVISDAEAADDLTISASGSVDDGALSANVSLLGSSIQDGEVDDDLTISGSGSVADGALSSNVSLLGATIEDLEVSDAITISGSGSVADGALSANVSLLGSSIDLTSEITGTLAVGNGGTGLTSFTTGDLVYASAANTLSSLGIGSNNQCLLVSGGVPTWGSCVVGGGGFTNLTLTADSGTNQTINDTDTVDIAGGTNINTVVGATDTVTVNLDSAPTITGLLSLTNAGTALSITNDATVGGDLTVTGNLVVGTTTFSETDLDALDDGLIALGTETSGTYDSTPDTIADDGVISDAEAADDLTISASGSVADGALSSNVSLLGASIQDGEVDDDLTISSGGSVDDGALSANVSLLGSSIDLTSEITGTLAVSNGGTGVTSIATNGVVFGAGTGAVQTTVGTAGQVLLADALGVPTFTTLTGEVTVSSSGVTDLVNDSLGVNNGNGITGGGTITLGGSRTISLGDLTSDWVQSGGFDIVLDNAGSELRIREASGVFYGELDVADITADRLYTFPDVDGDVTILGQTIENAELANNSITVTAGTGLTGGGTPALGGTVTLNSSLGTTVEGSEITNNTIEGVDLEVTSAGTDDYILTFDSASGGFEWVNPSAVGVTLSESEVEDFIFDGDNGAKSLSSGQLALDSLTYTGTLDDANVNDALTIGSSSNVDDGALSANVTLLGSSIALGSETTGNYVESVSTGNGLQGGVSGVGSTPTVSLGDFSSDWSQTAAFDLILDNSDSQLQIKDDSDTYYGTLNVASLSANQTYDFIEGGTVITTGNISDNATSGVTAGLGLTGGGTVGALTLNVGAGNGLTTNADDVEVIYGSTANTAVEGDTTITVSGGTGLSGGGLLTLGAGGTLTINSDLGSTIETGEITNDTILAVDLDNTAAPGAPEDTYVATYDNASGGFTWVSQASIAGAGGVTSLNSLTGGLDIVGNTQIGVSPSGSDVNLSINSGSIGATQLSSTSVSASGYGSASNVATFTVDADGRLTAAGNTAIAIDASQVTAGTLAVSRGGTGAGTLTSGGVLLGNGTGAIQDSGVLTNGQLLIGDGTGAPSVATLTQGSGITVTNGSGTITVASTLGTAIDGSEITDGEIEAVDLESTNVAGAGTDDYLVSYDDATGGFTYIDGSTVGTTLSEAQVEGYIFDGDNSGTLSSGTLALNSLSYTGNLTVAEGGTGLTAAGAAGGVYYSTGTAFANNGAGTAGQCLLSNGAGAPTWGNCGGSGAGAVTLQVAYNQGNVIATTNNRDLTFTLANNTTDSDFIVNIAASSTSEIAFQNNGSTLFRVDSGGIDLLDVDTADFTGATVTFDAGEIAEGEIAQNTLDDSEIQDNSLTAGSLAPDSVDTSEIATDAVDSDEIAADAVGSSEITANAVGASELASTSVGSGSYGNASTVATFTVDADGRLTAAGNSSINATLGTNTSGNYVESISAASLGGLSVSGGSGEGSTPTIALDQTQTLASNPGLSANQVIFGTTGLLFEGSSANSNETLLTAANATADRTITLPNASGTVAVSATGNINLSASGQISFTGTLPVSSGGTGATTLASGVLLGNGTGAITSTGALSNGQLLIGDGSGAPTSATLTQGSGITVTNGAGTITVASTLGTNINSSEIVNGSIAEIDLDISNTETSGWLLSSDGSGGFTWVDPSSVGVDEDTVEAYIFDADNTGTLSSGTLALDSLSYTGDLNDSQVNNSITVGSGGTVAGSAITNGTVANAALTNSSITVGSGSGLANGGSVSLGGSLTLNLGALTSNWDQTGAFDIELNNANSELRVRETGGGTDFATIDAGNLSGDQTFTFTNGGTVLTTGNIASNATTGVTAGAGLSGGGTIGVYALSVGAGNGISVNADDIEVDYGSVANTAVEGNQTISVNAGTGITGGGSITLGAGGSVTLNNELGTSIASNEIVNGTIQEVDLEATNAPTDNYLLTFDNATGGFTWVVPSAVGADEATVESYIFDGDNSGTLSSGTLALNSLSYTGNLSTTNGGTGLTAAGSAGGIYYSTGAAFANSGAGTSGQCLLSNGAGAPSWGNCGGSGAGAVTLQTAYDNGNQLDTSDNRDIIFNLANTTTDSDFVVNLQGADTQVFDVQNSGTSVLTVDGSGDVGIGDTTPSYKLDVSGTGRFTNDLIVDGDVDLGNLDTDTITFNGEVDSDVLPSADDTYDLGSSTARWKDLYLGPASLNVGNNTTNGTLSFNVANDEFSFSDDVNFVGNVGIGVNNPAQSLEVTGTSSLDVVTVSNEIVLSSAGTQTDPSIALGTGSGNNIGIYSNGTSNILFTIDDVQRLNVTAGELQFDGFLDIDTSGSQFAGTVTVGTSSTQGILRIDQADNNVSDSIQFYLGTTRMGEIGSQDTTWLRINQVTNKNIYTPRYIRADNGFYIDGTTYGLSGTGALQALAGSVGEAEIAQDTLDDSEIQNNSLTAGSLANNSVNSAEITDGQVTSADIANSTIVGGDVASNTLFAADIGANAIGNSEINNGAGFIIGGLTVNNTAATQGYIERNGISGSWGTNTFNDIWTGSCATLWIDNVSIGNYQCSSDQRVKQNINSLAEADGLDAINQLNPVNFDWRTHDDNLQYGFIAQEVQQIFPELVSNTGYDEGLTPGGLLELNYEGLISIAVKGIQQVDLKVEANTVAIDDLDSRLAVVENKDTFTNLTVTSDTTVQNITVNGKIITAGDTPTAVLGASSGTNSYYVLEGNDTAGYVEVQTGTSVSDGDQIEVTFHEAYDVAPRIAVTAKDAESASVRYFVETTTAGFVLNFIDAPQENTDYSFDYIVIQ